MTGSTFTSEFAFRDAVIIDGDTSIGVVTGLAWYGEEGGVVRVAWLHNGDARESWLHHWRLTKAS
jgi:hypothetical protein